jgi:hypothetical protein
VTCGKEDFMDPVELHAARQPPDTPMGHKPVSLPPEEADQLRAAGWTQAQIAAGKRQVAQPCRRCGGSGHLPGFRHVDGGRCLRCHAAGIDPKPTTEYAPSVRSQSDGHAAQRGDVKEVESHAAFDGWLAQRPQLAAAVERAEADIQAWKAWDGCRGTSNGCTTAKPHTPIAWNPFLVELTRQLRRREPLSDPEVAFYVRRIDEISRQAEQAWEREAQRVPAPEGSVTFTGTVAAIRSQPGYRGRVEAKMLVIGQTADGLGEFRVWCTVPRRSPSLREGDRIILTAELCRSERDASFAFGKRPRLSAPGGAGRWQPKAPSTAAKRRRRRRGVPPAPAG